MHRQAPLMILSIGTDLVDVRRIEALIHARPEQSIQRLFTPKERAQAESITHEGRRMLRYANRFAAKEALVKALGGRGKNIRWHEMEILSNAEGAPIVRLRGHAEKAARALLPERQSAYHIHLSLSDEYPYAQAFVVISTSNQ